MADDTLGIQTFVAATYESATIIKNTSVDADLMCALHKGGADCNVATLEDG